MEKETSELIRQLAQKLGTTVEHLYSVLVKQAFIEGINNIFNWIILLILGLLLIYFYKKFFQSRKEALNQLDWKTEEKINTKRVFIYIGFGFWCVYFLILLCHFGEFITCFVNPEYWAIREILNYIKK